MSKMDSIKVSVEEGGNDKKEEEKSKPAPKKASPKKSVAKKEASKTKSKKQKSVKIEKKGFFSHLFVVAMTALIVGGGIYYWQSEAGKESIDKLRNDARNTRINLENSISSIKDKLQMQEEENKKLKETEEELKQKANLLNEALKKYSNPDLKLSFYYPVLFGEVNIDVTDEEGAARFVGTFSENEQLLFGGISKDYNLPAASSTENQIFDNYGFGESGNNYYLRTIHGKNNEYEVEPMRVVETKNGKAIMLNKDGFLLDKESESTWDFGLGQDIAAVINLDGEDFQGMTIINKSTAKFPLANFEEMLESIKIN